MSPRKKTINDSQTAKCWEEVALPSQAINYFLGPPQLPRIHPRMRGLGHLASDWLSKFHPVSLFRAGLGTLAQESSDTTMTSGPVFTARAVHDFPLNQEKPTAAPPELFIEELSPEEISELRQIDRLVKDAQFNPGQAITGSELFRLLSSMPHPFRATALSKYQQGHREFGKIPITALPVTSPDIDRVGHQVVEPPRPMGCPEPAPEGAYFILAWREGDWWNWSLPNESDHHEEPGGNWMSEYGKYLSCIKFCSTSEDPEESEHSRLILKMLNRQSNLQLGLQNRSEAEQFIAGVRFARLILYKSADKLYVDRLSISKNPWPSIIRHLLDRHGLEMSYTDILDKLRASAPKSKDVELSFEWNYAPPEPITRAQFEQKFNDVKTKIDRRSCNEAAIDKLRSELAPPLKKDLRRAKAKEKKQREKAAELERKKSDDTKRATEAALKRDLNRRD